MRRVILFLLLLLWTPAAPAEDTKIAYSDHGIEFSAAVSAAYIDLGDLKVYDFGAFERFLEQLPNLRQVDMYATHMYKNQADRFAQRFPHIRFGWTLYFGDHTIRTDQTVFSTFHTYNPKRHNSKALEILRHCTELRALDLGHNALTDISFLSGLTELKILILADNQVADLTPLSQLSKLEYVELFDNRIRQLDPLSSLDHLLDLNIAQNRVTNLDPLMNMTGLNRLWLRSCGTGSSLLTPEALDTLQICLPQTQIDSVSLGTNGGWRSHPHYDILFDVFQSQIYRPFADSHPDTAQISPEKQ